MPPRAHRRLKWPDIDMQSFRTCSGRVSLPVVSATLENLDWISEHSLTINVDIGLPGRFCTVQAEKCSLAFGCVMGLSRLLKPSYHIGYFWLKVRRNHVLITGTTGYQLIICIGTHKGIFLEFCQEIVGAYCEKEGIRWSPGANLH